MNFLLLYGRPPPSLLQYVPKTAKVQSVEDSLYERDRMKLLRDHLNLARDKMKFFAEKRTNRKFEVGDLVLLKLQPYRQISVRSALPQKLAAILWSL